MRGWNWWAGVALGIPLLMLGCYAAARSELSGRRRSSLAALVREAEGAALVGDWSEAARLADEAFVRFHTRRLLLRMGLPGEGLARLEAAIERLRSGIYRRQKSEVVSGASLASRALHTGAPFDALSAGPVDR